MNDRGCLYTTQINALESFECKRRSHNFSTTSLRSKETAKTASFTERWNFLMISLDFNYSTIVCWNIVRSLWARWYSTIVWIGIEECSNWQKQKKLSYVSHSFLFWLRWIQLCNIFLFVCSNQYIAFEGLWPNECLAFLCRFTHFYGSVSFRCILSERKSN